ncbi:MAG: hypothetical protein OXG51_06125 [Gammaproteobacteria bacterium]|nr:hypothetical protein [Gammaproteobacteria bacterium]
MAPTEGAWEDGSVAALHEVADRMRVRFDRQCLLSHDAIARPWNQLPPSFPRTAFDAECLINYEATTRSRLLEAIRAPSVLTQPRRVKVRTEVLEKLFGRFAPGHAFLEFNPDWGIEPTEPMATRALAHLLGRGRGKLKAERIHAFLEALKIPDLPMIRGDHSLKQAKVHSEVNRIDLEIRFQTTPGVKRVVLIEAKFRHHITQGQLRTYYEARKNYDRRDCRIVGLTSDAGKGRRGKQIQVWPIVLWRDLWLRFEQRRPYETDGQLAAFMAWLWQRIDGLSPSNRKSR